MADWIAGLAQVSHSSSPGLRESSVGAEFAAYRKGHVLD
jgi:hypothetical protein